MPRGSLAEKYGQFRVYINGFATSAVAILRWVRTRLTQLSSAIGAAEDTDAGGTPLVALGAGGDDAAL